MPDRDEETGRYTDEYPGEAFLKAIREAGELAGTGEIADAVGCAHDTAYKKLQAMEEDGQVTSRLVGNSLVWSLTEAGE